MSTAFFVTDIGELYADMAATEVKSWAYEWLVHRQIDLGRKSSFIVKNESPVLHTPEAAENWMQENGFALLEEELLENVDKNVSPTEEHYQEIARIAQKINEMAAVSKLAEILPFEADHSFLCQVGVWYWQIGHKHLAIQAYERSFEIEPEAATCFNAAVCHDDIGNDDLAAASMKTFYALVSNQDEREQAEKVLRANGKKHLVLE